MKVEIAKIKKIAAIKDNELKDKEDKKASSSENPGWVTNQDSALLRPKDYKALQKELSTLKSQVNEAEAEKKLLKASAEKYERRAKYTLEKFQEIKAKEMQLIQLGEDKAKGELNLMESKYKKKLEKLNIKAKALEEENNA